MTLTKKRLIRLLALALLTLGFGWYLNSNWSNFQEISLTSPVFFMPAFVFVLINIYSLGALLETAIEPHGIKLSKNEIFGLSSLTRFGNYVSPGYLGAAIRAIYLKKNYDIAYTKFSSSFAVSNLLQFLISGTIVLLIYLSHTTPTIDSRPMWLVLLVVILFLFLFYMPITTVTRKFKDKDKGRMLKLLIETAEEYDKVRSFPRLTYRMFFWMLITLTSSSITLFTFYHMLGFTIGILPVIFITALGNWAIIFSITPASIGIREGLMALGARLMGVPIPLTLTVAILLRLVTFVCVSALSAYYAPKLLNTTLTNIRSIKNS